MVFSIYPNPARTFLNIIHHNQENIVITNLLSEIVLEKIISGIKTELDVSVLSSGIYFIKSGNEIRKFVKQ